MHYSNLIRCSVQLMNTAEEAPVAEKVAGSEQEKVFTEIVKAKPENTESEMMSLLRQIAVTSDQQAPKSITDSILTDEEVDRLLPVIEKFGEKYFPDIPMSQSLEQRFVFNIPRVVIDAINFFERNEDLPDILNPLILLYLFFTDVPMEAIGRWWEHIAAMMEIDGIREAINDDAQRYLADMMDGDEEEDEYGEDEDTEHI